MVPAATPPLLVTVNVWLALATRIGVLPNDGGDCGVMVNVAGLTHLPFVPLQTRPPAQARPAVQTRHVDPPAMHWPLAHGGDVGIVQSPSMLHTDAVVWTPPAQLAGVHWTSAPW